ncbi:MAG: TerB family tellurite resistance protein [Paracoccus sp. (in: a-proteobacteria)]|nr:TerB family tellurite resistance protein [Paracoccus sp. (in: a-proteobacteria)]
MFNSIMSHLFGTQPSAETLSREDADIAVAALLVRVARADDHYSQAEQTRIDMVLARLHGLSMAEAAAQRAEAEQVEANAPDTVRFTRQIKDRIALEDRSGVLAALWEIAYADGDRGADEEALIRLVAGLLGINDRDSGLIRQRVIAGMPSSEG